MVTGCGRPRFLAKNQKRQAGVTFLVLLFAIAIGGIALSGAAIVWQMEVRREKEKELLFVGEEFRRAILSYANTSPSGRRDYPARLEDLLLDKRFPMPVRHLRRIYRDPLGPDGEWTLIRQQGRIIGVASKSQEKPIKIAGFGPTQSDFEGAKSYAEWRFVPNGL